MADNNAKNDDMKHCYENLILIDASASLTNKKFSRDLDSVIQRAQDAGNLWLISFHLMRICGGSGHWVRRQLRKLC